MIDHIDSVFLFGTGIVSGPWEPVLRALAKKYGTNLGRDAKGQDVATRWLGLHGINTPSKPPDQQLANWVFGVRVNSARIVASLGAPRNPKVKRATDGMRAELLDLKKTIASELSAAQDSGETRLREGPVAAAVLDAGEGSTAMLTTNWDLTLERWIRANLPETEPKVLHVHGSIERPSTMLLPGEVLNEPHRDGADKKYLKNTYVDAMGHFAYANRVYVVGLSLSRPDAALGAALNEGLQVWIRKASKEASGEVVVVNLQEDMERITGQVRMLIPDRWSVRPLPPRKWQTLGGSAAP